MITIPAVRECCAGIDVGKRGLAVALLQGPADKEATIETRWYGTTVPALTELKQWLQEAGCGSAAMESTGSYWIPVKNVLEGAMDLTLVCSRKHRPKKGDKTDFKDGINLAQQHRHGLLTGSYLPERGVVELRDLTRRRKKLQGNLASEKNRIQKTLEVANVKIGNVISDVFGISGQEMLRALLSARALEPGEIADLAKTRLRLKIPQLTEALQDHHMNDHHRWLIQQSVDHIVVLDRQMEALEERIADQLAPYRTQFELLLTIPGMKDLVAATILAEVGPYMEQFPSADHLCSWAGVCPGNNRSAGKSKSSHIKKANKFLLAALVQASWAAARKRNSLFRRKFHRWIGKLGKTKANIALCRCLLRVVYSILKEGRPYVEPDVNQLHTLERQKLVHHHARRLRQLGAEPEAVQQIIEQLLAADPTQQPQEEATVEPTQDPTPPAQTDELDVVVPVREAAKLKRTRSATSRSKNPAFLCLGVLGFRARQRRREYSVVKHPPGKPPVKASPETKRRKKSKPDP